MPIADGAVFAGYTIIRLLGTGGMGEVYLVQHPRLPRRDALKILPADVSANPEYRQRFVREAELASSLSHSHIVAVHDQGEDDGQLWIAMAYVEGTDAAQLVRDRYPHGMPRREAVEIVSAIADALDYAHESYLLHRDVKPANILITHPSSVNRRILLADFGIARAMNETSGLTATNVAVGSVAYAAPEQLMGESLDGRADQYALACTAFHLLTGRPPFTNTNPAVVISNHLSLPPPRIGEIRPDLASFESALGAGMAKTPFQRFDTCREFAAALADANAGAPGPNDATQRDIRISPDAGGGPPRGSLPTKARDSPTPPRRAALTAGGIVVALVAVGLVAFVGARLGKTDLAPSTFAGQPTSTLQPATTLEPLRTVTQTVPPLTVTAPPPSLPPTTPPGDLGLSTPMSYPACNGQGIVILGSVTTPGLYAASVQRLLNDHPGSFYLRTDRTCPSLRQATPEGNPIYAVYELGGSNQSDLCAAVRSAGGDAYGKFLDTTTDPGYVVPC
ncbi:hypothetical protein MMAD_17480 [Mycolicibacterium madagascariense]|uniref:non-specific serine/threonine protein kinase n=1 Tax=Mycolicibacterium madagascariense TaxID=212765 RepID=A0A7I7XE53_9MYCO|nr:serine/threonine-protein kinase [Mycolicibacterium madagascariense]MCV7015160.1 serine/threonine protein kinase [Mycolicibacterium madagascariense]BBZ27453.1 hypothetical protein MMAD_17480 [Mycolicibacterium madagascariense]